jgi:polyferredoxin/plastocyanin
MQLLTEKKQKAFLIIALLLVVALAVPIAISRLPHEPETHVITLEASKYKYNPSRIVVNQGDTIIIKPTATDVTHGFFLDGYDLEFTIKQEGNAFLKYTWTDDEGVEQIDWDKVKEVEFVADKAGKYIFRCFQICGNLHPFMTGELVVKPNGPFSLMMSLSIWMLVSLLTWNLVVGQKDAPQKKVFRLNLFQKLPLLEKAVKSRWFQFVVIFPNLIVFYLFILSALWGSPVGNRNIAIIFVWILWWFALKAIFVPLGARLWCMICPLPAPAEWISRRAIIGVRFFEKPFRRLHHRFTGLQREWPKKLQNMWLQNVIFMLMISFGIILITRPVATAFLFLIILSVTIVLTLVFRLRVFCLYLCPVGGFLGNYSMASMTEIRAIDYEVCKQHKEKSCLVGSEQGWGCPWKQYIGTMKRNNYCGFCMECIKSCPKDNIGIFIRPFGEDKRVKGYDEMYNIIIMLVVAIAFSITMLGPWGLVKDAANVTEVGNLPRFLIYVAILWLAAMVVFPWLFVRACALGRFLAQSRIDTKELALTASFTLIPVGIFAWIAFSLPSVLVNYNYILIVLSDPLGLGWDLFGSAGMPFKPFYPQWIPIIQGMLLLTGLYLGVSRGDKALKSIIGNTTTRTIVLIPPVIYAWGMVSILLKLYLG